MPGGMVKLEIVLLPDEADLVLRALDRAREVGHTDGDVSAGARKCDDAHANASAEASSPEFPSCADGAVAL